MIIRPYTEADFQGIAKVIRSCQTEECWPHYYPNGWDEQKIRSEFSPLEGYKHPFF